MIEIAKLKNGITVITEPSEVFWCDGNGKSRIGGESSNTFFRIGISWDEEERTQDKSNQKRANSYKNIKSGKPDPWVASRYINSLCF